MLEVTPLSDQIENVIREEILSGALVPGQKLSIDDLSSRWGVSSTPIRDAIRRLEKVGFLKVAPRKGVYVADFDQKEFKNIFDLRIALESLAVESASVLIPENEIDMMIEAYQNAHNHFLATGDRALMVEYDPMIHDVLIRYCDNDRLKEIVRDLHDLLDWARRTVSARRPETYEQAFPEHMKILDGLKARNVQLAQIALREHLQNSFKRANGSPV
jgi:DNA-binding GntR family transcriptional regulator